jgi:hypothetical protein
VKRETTERDPPNNVVVVAQIGFLLQYNRVARWWELYKSFLQHMWTKLKD